MSAPPETGRGSIYIQNPTLRRGFTSTPNRVLCNAALSMGARFVYTLLLSYAWQDDRCFPGQERLARDVGCSVRTVQRYLVELEEAGEIRVIQQGLQRPNIYVILDRHPDATPLSRQEAPSMAYQETTEATSPDTPTASVPETSRLTPDKGSPSRQRRREDEDPPLGGGGSHSPGDHTMPANGRRQAAASRRGRRRTEQSLAGHPSLLPGSRLDAGEVVGLLLTEGVSPARADALAARFPRAEIEQQIRWLDGRRYDDRAACLVAAIEGRYGPPVAGTPQRPRPTRAAVAAARPTPAHDDGSPTPYAGGSYGVCPACLSWPHDVDCPLRNQDVE